MRESKSNPTGTNAAHPAALKIVLGLGGIFIVLLVGARLARFAEFALSVHRRAPLVWVEPGTTGNLMLLAAVVVAPLVLLLPRKWRLGTAFVLLLVALAGIGFGGNLAARGGPGATGATLAHSLEARGYARCAAGDRIRGSGRATRGEYVAEAWALPGACPATDDPPAQR